MQDKQHARSNFAQSILPWIVALGFLVLYLVTINSWVTLSSLFYTASVAGWDWRPPSQSPLFFTLTYPFRWLPSGGVPMALNVFSAVCSALTLALLVRSVALLPHDRTHAQRQRERSEFSLLSIPTAWVPPLLAALVCGLELTFWEHSTSATNESLNLLIFAYCIRCLLEFRIDQRESWLWRMAFVYGLGVTNNWAMIGFLPLFMFALIWIKGFSFFNFGFVVRMLLSGAAGLCLYALLPLIWTTSGYTDTGFWGVLHGELMLQKRALLDTAGLRSRAFILSLASILPLFIIGFRWPTTFGDTSAAGAFLTNFMFRVIHFTFFVVCIWVAFDFKFSPRTLGAQFGLSVPFLTFYYIGALCVGYYSGYLLLTSSDVKTSKNWRRRSGLEMIAGRFLAGLVWLALVLAPVTLIYKNFHLIQLAKQSDFHAYAKATANALPEKGALVLSDDPIALLLVRGEVKGLGRDEKYTFVHTQSLPFPEYHRQMLKLHPQTWPNVLAGLPVGSIIDDVTLLNLMQSFSKNNDLYYLHPSFGYYFEYFYPEAKGPIYQLKEYPQKVIYPPELGAQELDRNQAFWNQIKDNLNEVQQSANAGSSEADYLCRFYSRGLNFLGVENQKAKRLDKAAECFKLASDLNTNNVNALVNVEYNKTLRTGESRTNEISRLLTERFGRSWEGILTDNGPFDQPDVCLRLGSILAGQNLLRQAAILMNRTTSLQPNRTEARLGLANLLLRLNMPEEALAEIGKITVTPSDEKALAVMDADISRVKAAIHMAKADTDGAEKELRGAFLRHPKDPTLLDALVSLYNQTGKQTNAMALVEKTLKDSPDNVSALINQAAIYYNLKNYPKSFETLDRVLAIDPKNTAALLYKVLLYVDVKDYKNAGQAVVRSLEIDPDNTDALLYQAVIAIESKDYDKAIPPLDRILKNQPSNWNALKNHAIANLQRNSLKNAKEDFIKLQKQGPRSYIPYFGLGEIAYRQRQKSAAIRNYELYLNYVPESATGELAKEKQLVQERLRELKGG